MDRPGHLQLQPRQSKPRLSLLPLLREQAWGNCLPMVTCQWRQALVAVVEKGLGAGWRVPVLVWALAVVQGQEEAADRAMGQMAAVASQPAP